jgi:hypothetical protein
MRWNPPIELSAQETRICNTLKKQRRFFRFLRLHRHRLFDEAFQQKLATRYSDRPRGTLPDPPALLATVVLLQAYTAFGSCLQIGQIKLSMLPEGIFYEPSSSVIASHVKSIKRRQPTDVSRPFNGDVVWHAACAEAWRADRVDRSPRLGCLCPTSPRGHASL